MTLHRCGHYDITQASNCREPESNDSGFFTSAESEMRVINAHPSNTYHVGRASVATPDVKITASTLL